MSSAGNSPSFRQCRYCGDILTRARAPLEVCIACADSPLCDRCGHPRADHTHVFTTRTVAGCSHVIRDFQSLSQRRCDCEGFAPVRTQLRDATFAAPDPDPLALPLRTIDLPPRETAPEAHRDRTRAQLELLADALDAVGDLAERAEELLDDDDELLRLLAGVRGALAQIADDHGAIDSR